MRKSILYLAGVSLLALAVLAPATTWAKSDRDWGVTVGPGGVHVGPSYRHYDRDRYAYRHRYDDEDWRYRRDRDRDYY